MKYYYSDKLTFRGFTTQKVCTGCRVLIKDLRDHFLCGDKSVKEVLNKKDK